MLKVAERSCDFTVIAPVQRTAYLSAMTESARLKIKVQLHCGDEIAMGPGKADLLDAIRTQGSISAAARARSEEHTSELQSLMRISYAVFCLEKKKTPIKRDDQYQDVHI